MRNYIAFLLALGPAFAVGESASAATASPIYGGPTTIAAYSDEDSALPNQEDYTFVYNVLKDGRDQIDLAKLAQERSADPQIQALAEQVIRDRGAFDARILHIAYDQGISTPGAQSDAGVAEVNELGMLEGRAFDRTYARDVAVAERHLIGMLQLEESTTDQSLLAAVDSGFPLVRDDLALAQTDLDQLVGYRPD
jgi:predicted outer membrane protein